MADFALVVLELVALVGLVDLAVAGLALDLVGLVALGLVFCLVALVFCLVFCLADLVLSLDLVLDFGTLGRFIFGGVDLGGVDLAALAAFFGAFCASFWACFCAFFSALVSSGF